MPSDRGNPRRFKSSKLWIAPIVGASFAGVAAGAALAVDHLIAWEDPPLPLFSGDADTARTMLSVIATAVTTLLALVFTIITVVIQLASGQYSPRALRTLLKDRPTQFTIGVFVGTITYALITLLALRVPIGDDLETAAGLAPTLAFGLAVLSIVTFAVFSNHIAHSVTVSSLVSRVANETREIIDRRLSDPFDRSDEDLERSAPPSDATVVRADRSGVLVGVDEDGLFELAVERDVSLRVIPKLGDYVPERAPLFAVMVADGVPLDDAHDLVTLTEEDVPEHDPGWGIRMLVDIAIRALSPGINDPSTAAQAIDRIGDLLGRIAGRSLVDARRVDDGGSVRLVVPTRTWPEFVALGIDEIHRFGADDLQASERLRASLAFLLDVSPPPRRPPVAERLASLDRRAQREGVDVAPR